MPRTRTSLRRMLPQYGILDAQPDVAPLMLIASPELADAGPELVRGNIRHRMIKPVVRQDRDHFPRWIERLVRSERICHGLPVSLLRMRKAQRALKKSYAALRLEFERLRPVAILMPGDRELGFVQPALRAAADLGIPTAVSEAGIPSPESQVATRRGEWRFTLGPGSGAPILNRIAERRYPAQAFDGAEGRILFTPGWLTLVLAREGMMSRHPWVQGGGLSSAIFAASEERAKVLMRHGVPRAKIRVIGDLVHDPLHGVLGDKAGLRQRLIARHQLRAGLPLIIFAVPNYAEHNLMTWPDHLAKLETVFEELAGVAANVLLSLHPKSQRQHYEQLAKNYALPIHDVPLIEWLPAADLFVSGSSSTMEWAAMCGIPAVNVDYAGIKDPAWDNFLGIIHAATAEEVGTAVRRLVDDADHRARLATAQTKSGNDVSIFDGRSGERFVAAVRGLMAAKVAIPVGGHACIG